MPVQVHVQVHVPTPKESSHENWCTVANVFFVTIMFLFLLF